VSRNVLLGILGVIVFIAVLAYMSMGMRQHRVEVCVNFQGRTNCRIASGPTQEQAVRTATDNACATIASGMTESMSCGQTPPTSVKWLD
jgi:hypothetical protein